MSDVKKGIICVGDFISLGEATHRSMERLFEVLEGEGYEIQPVVRYPRPRLGDLISLYKKIELPKLCLEPALKPVPYYLTERKGKKGKPKRW